MINSADQRRFRDVTVANGETDRRPGKWGDRNLRCTLLSRIPRGPDAR